MLQVQPVDNVEHTSLNRPSSSAFQSCSTTTGQSKSKRQKVVNPDNLLLQATTTMAEMSQLAKERSQVSGVNEDSFDTFGKFVAAELRSINTESNNAYLVRQAKRKIQQILMDTWDTVESGSILSSTASSIHSFATSPTIIVQNASGLSNDVIANAIQLSNLNDNMVSADETEM